MIVSFKAWLKRRPFGVLGSALTLGFSAGAAASVLGFLRIRSWSPPLVGWGLKPITPPAGPLLEWSPAARAVATIAAQSLAFALWIAAALALAALLSGFLHLALMLSIESVRRRPEWAMRAAVGASIRQIRSQQLGEGVVLGGIGLGLGLLLGWAGHAALGAYLPNDLELAVGESMPGGIPGVPAVVVLALTAASLVAVSLLASPSSVLIRSPARFLRQATGPRTGGSSSRASGAGGLSGWLLATGEVAAAVVVVVAAFLLVEASPTSEREAAAYPYATDTLVLRASIASESASGKDLEALRNDILRWPGVEAAAVASPGAFLGLGTVDRVVAECPWCLSGLIYMPVTIGRARYLAVGPGFFNVLRGERVAALEHTTRPWVDRRFREKLFQGRTPNGQHLWFASADALRDPGVEVAGVADAPPPVGLGAPESPRPAVFLPIDRRDPMVVDIALRGWPQESLSDLRSRAVGALEQVVPAGQVRVLGTLSGLLEERRAPIRWLAAIASTLALICLLLAVWGVVSTVRSRVQARAAEIGLRRTVGAKKSDIRALVLAEARGVVGAGGVAGCVLATSLNRALPGIVPGIEPLPIWAILVVAALLGAIAVVASLIAARDAMRPRPAALL